MDVIDPKLRNILANTTLYQMLDEAELNLLAAATVPVRVGSHKIVVNQGDAPAGVFWLVYGQVRVGVCNPQGREKTLALLGPGKCFGVGEVLHGEPYAAFAKSSADCLLLHTSREAVLALAEQNLKFAGELLRCLGRQLCALLFDIEAQTQSARQRLASYLLRQSAPGGELRLVGSKVLVASRLSLCPETLSRLLREFSSDGLIRVHGLRIAILDRERMEALAL